MESLVIAMNMQNNAPSQYVDFPFESVVEFNGKTVLFGSTGIFEEGGDSDNGTDITAWVDTPLHDFGAREQKSIEAFSVGYECDGALVFTLYGDEDDNTTRSFVMEPVKDGQVQQDFMKTLKKYRWGKARYWKARLANRDGSDFSIDYIALAPVKYKRRSKY